MENESEDVVARLEADNRRLRRLLDQRGAPRELRHRLRNTLLLLRSIIRRSGQTQRDIESFVGQVEDRLDAIMRIQHALDEHGAVDLHTLIADELLHYGASEGERVSLAGPTLELGQRAGQIFALAIHELMANSVEHGVLGGGDGRVSIMWSRTQNENPALTFKWIETGVAPGQRPGHEGFGTEVLTRILVYQLGAQTTLSLEADEMRWTVVAPLWKLTDDPPEIGVAKLSPAS